MTVPKHTFPRVAGRFISGRPLDGRPRTNATFLARADRDLTPHGRASRWHHAPGWQRAAWRTGFLALALAALYGRVKAPQAETASALVAVPALLALAAWRACRAWRTGRHMRRVVTPLFQTASAITGHPPNDNPNRHLKVPHNYKTKDKPEIIFKLPPKFEGSAAEQKRLHTLFERRLGGDWHADWRLNEYPAIMRLTPAPAPPGKVMLADLRRAIESAKPGNLIIGLGTGRVIQCIDLDSESPHVALSMGTGGGKTSTLRLIIAQLKRQGCERIDIIDPKRVSHNWAKNIPGVYIHRTMAEQMEAIHNFRLRMEMRYDALDTDADMQFARQALIIEEQNSWMSYAQTYWQDYRAEAEPEARRKMPPRNPAIGDLAYCLFQGRQACMNIISVFQRMSASASGGGDMRENYGAKILARFSPQTWKLLVGTVPVPRSSRHPGRGLYALGDEYHAVQFGYLREAKAKDWPGVPESDWRDEAFDFAMEGITPDTREPEPEPAAPVTLREAADAQVIPMRYAALRKARARALRASDPAWPAGKPSPAGTVYPPEDLRAWHDRKMAAKVG